MRRRGGYEGQGSSLMKGPRVDVLAWFARATLDVIGEAGMRISNALNRVLAYSAHPGFGYAFDSLSGGKESELAQAFGVIFSTARKFRVMTILQVWFPVLRRFVRLSGCLSYYCLLI